MKLKRLEIQQLPGIEPGFTLEKINPGGNLVTGPNAIGKSSLHRALRYLIAGTQRTDPKELVLSATFEGQKEDWTVHRNGRRITWEKGGNKAEAPPLPDPEKLYCYWLSMEDLLQVQANQQDEHLITELRRALGGGYDMNALKKKENFQDRPRHGNKEAKALRKAEQTAREVERAYTSLQQEEKELPQLEERIQKARTANETATRLEQALSLLAASQERQRIEAGLEEFPQGMKQLRGDERERLEKLEQKQAQQKQQQTNQHHTLEEAVRRLQATGLAKDRPNKTDLEARTQDLAQARRLEDQYKQKHKELTAAEVAETQALENLGGKKNLGGKTPPPKLGPKSVSRAEELAKRLQASEHKQQELKEGVAQAGQAPDPLMIDRYSQATESLRTWLDSETSNKSLLRKAILLAGGGGLLAATPAFYAASQGDLTGATWISMIGGIIALAGAIWALLETRSSDSQAAKKRFQQCELEEPERWEKETVKERLQELERERLTLKQQEIRAKQAEQERYKLIQTEKELAELQQEKIELATELGFDPKLTAAGMDRFVRSVEQYQQAQEKKRTATKESAQLNEQIQDRTKKISKLLQQWQPSDPEGESLDFLEKHIEALKKRCEEAEKSEQACNTAKQEYTRILEALAAIEKEITEFFQEAGLEAGEQNELNRRCQQFQAWQAQQEKLREASTIEKQKRQELKDQPNLLKRVETDQHVFLQRDLEQAQEKARSLEALQEERTRLHTRLQEVGKDLKLEQAMEQKDKAHIELENKYDEAIFADSAHLLLDKVQQEYRNEHEPEILRNARERFLKFTHNTFALEIDEQLDEQQGFAARDLKQQARRKLSELSSATRMQLLLATRLAWTQSLERGRESLPLFLDEALTNSDEDRFSQVAQSLHQLIEEEGRQIFYLSTRKQEATLWERATGKALHPIDLAEVRFAQKDKTPQDYTIPQKKTLPSPQGETPEGYAKKLKIPPINPRLPTGNFHIFHLLRDQLDLLHDLMENYLIRTQGQLEALLSSSAATHAIPEKQTRVQLQGRCKTARAWTKAWNQGRGKEVTRIALEQSRHVTDVFIDPVSELAEKLGGNAEALIQAIEQGEIPRFYSRNKEKLTDFLKQEGYIDEEETLTQEERERRILENLAGQAPPQDIRQVTQWLETASQQENN